MIVLSALKATLTRLKPSHLLGLAMKLLNLPTDGTLIASSIGRILGMVVGDHIIRALGRQRDPKQFQFVTFGEPLDMDSFTSLEF